MKNFWITAALMLTTASLQATPSEVWTGTGEIRTLENELLQTYTLKVTREKKSPTLVMTKIEVTATDGKKLYEDQCEINTNSDHSWKKTCSHSTGGGYMMNYNLGSEYTADKAGKAWSTNVVLDAPNRMRLQRVELLNGKAQKWFVETLQKAD